MSKARITYRIHHDKQEEGTAKPAAQVIPLRAGEFSVEVERQPQAAEEPKTKQMYDVQALNQFTTDFGAWQSPFDMETDRLEQLIRQTDQPEQQRRESSARFLEQEDSMPIREEETWRDPYPPMEEDLDPETGYYAKQGPDWYEAPARVRYSGRNGGAWLRMGASIAGAIATGVVFGYVVLSFFSGPENETAPVGTSVSTPAPSEDVSAGVQEDSGAIPLVEDNTDSEAAPTTGEVTDSISKVELNLPEQSYYVLQHGIFSTEEGAVTAMAALQEKGFAGIPYGQDKITVFAGLTTNKNDALALSEKLRGQDVEIFTKTLAIPAASQIVWNGDKKSADAAASYFLDGRQLVDSITQSIAFMMQSEKPKADVLTFKALKQQHQAWTSNVQVMRDAAPSNQQAQVDAMSKAMDTAMLSLEAFGKNPSMSHLWKAQASLASYALHENGLLSAIALP